MKVTSTTRTMTGWTGCLMGGEGIVHTCPHMNNSICLVRYTFFFFSSCIRRAVAVSAASQEEKVRNQSLELTNARGGSI